MTDQEVKVAFLAKLKDSGLGKNDAERLRWRAFSALALERQCARWGVRLPVYRDGFVIPYYPLGSTQPNGFFRHRRLDSNAEPRYLQPVDSGPELFWPCTADWKALLAKPETPLTVCEGELKAAAAARLEFSAVGLGGVWNYQSTRLGIRSLFGKVDPRMWKERRLYYACDSDVATNASVLAARNRGCDLLTELGAHVFVVPLPALAGLKKTGLDDYLVVEGAEGYFRLCKQAEEWAACRELHYLNEKVLWVHDQARVFDYGAQRLFTKEDFFNNYSDRPKYLVPGEKKPRVPAHEWAENPVRNKVSRLTFDPAQPAWRMLPPTAHTEFGEFNFYPGLAVQPKKGNLKPWFRLLKWIFPPGMEKECDWFLSWAAWPLQQLAAGRSNKMHSACALISYTEGTGKGLLGLTLARVYGRLASSITLRQLRSEFNEWKRGKLFIVGNEITGKEARQYHDQLSDDITEPTVWIREMYKTAYQLPNTINYFFTSNHNDAFFLKFTDRRFFIHRTPERKLVEATDCGWGRAGIDEYLRYMESSEAAAALLAEFLGRDLGSFDHRQPPLSAAKIELQETVASTAALWARQAAQQPEIYLGADSTRCLWLASELLAKCDPEGKTKFTEKGMGHVLGPGGWVALRKVRGLLRARAEYVKAQDGKGMKPVIRNEEHQGKLWTLPANEAAMRRLNDAGLAEQFNRERGFVVPETPQPRRRLAVKP